VQNVNEIQKRVEIAAFPLMLIIFSFAPCSQYDRIRFNYMLAPLCAASRAEFVGFETLYSETEILQQKQCQSKGKLPERI